MNLLRILDLSRETIEEILDHAHTIKKSQDQFRFHLRDKHVCLAFFEPSTRTRVGFTAAAQKLGAHVVAIYEPRFKEGMSIPESIGDTLRVVGDYSDCVVLRSQDADLIDTYTPGIPLINAGNGADEHPTQALIDLYAIKKKFGRLEGLTVACVGDLTRMRSAHSLVLALDKFKDNTIHLISPAQAQLPKNYLTALKHTHIEEYNHLALEDEDVVYMAGLPPIAGVDREGFALTAQAASKLAQHTIVLCPLPRVDEITKDVDTMPCAHYFQQSKDGLYVRMAALNYCMKRCR